MRRHKVTVDGATYEYVSRVRVGYQLTIEAPGLAPFDVDDRDGNGIRRAREILRSVYSNKANEQ